MCQKSDGRAVVIPKGTVRGGKAFYLRLGLDESPLEPMTLMITVQDLQAAMRIE